ncbi:dynein light chain binding protein [Aureococcus anophagefferens]|nr:dynein light chain binding protein [Aureococcus anophagefferens]
MEITDGADKQLKIENDLKEIDGIWQVREFSFKDWKTRAVPTLQGTGLLMEELEEAQMALQTMLTMRHVAPFREETQEQLAALSDASDTLERWVKVQLMWCSLESVFTGGDIAKQLPMEAKKFGKVDKDWGKLMSKSEETRLVVECCQNEMLKSKLPEMYTELEKCQKSLEGYLEAKRSRFPRFYFCSNSKLLIILSQGSDPTSMNAHYETVRGRAFDATSIVARKVFDALEKVDHDKKDRTIIRKMHGAGGKGHEEIMFVKPVPAQGNIEDWLTVLLKYMQKTMKYLCSNAGTHMAAAGTEITTLRHFVDEAKAQFALLGIQFMWTTDTQNSLEECSKKKNSMKECNSRQLDVLRELSSWCLQDLGFKVNRKKIETLVTIHVHQKDVTKEMFDGFKRKEIKDANDFEWTKQARFYWRNNGSDETSDDGACVISITDADFTYQYEYLGAKERLVITPLTDRCYITLAQALNMCFGGAPAGPAGTGKTETVKDLGATLGIFVVVTNCGDQMSYKDCAKIFKGLCQSGLWGCFDEFNRIRLPVLSVVAQQVLSIQNAKKAGSLLFQFPGDPQNVSLNRAVGYFITMNPGYAGRQALPENLKALFRGVTMMTPDFQIIMKVKLCSVGYNEYELLAQKFFVLYDTCKLQLSNQKHYDWGLRNILSVLRTMGASKRGNMDKAESYLVYQTLRDMNLSKLVAQDVPLFLSILADLFPAMSAPPKAEYPDMEAALMEEVEKAGLIFYEGPDGATAASEGGGRRARSKGTRGGWVGKVIQLYETTRVRHGIMLDSRFNPKAIRAQEMYGEMDPLSGEWTTGVYAAMWAKYNNRANPYNTWIIADGPVDAIWIEDLNTVLDDNRILTLANGDRMPMTDNVKMMFEVETLVNASPATVSRAGIIYIADVELDWEAVYRAWVLTRPSDHQTILYDLAEKWLGKCTPIDPGVAFSFITRNCVSTLQAGRITVIQSLLTLITGLCDGETIKLHMAGSLETGLERVFLYAFCWSFGALFEAEDRNKLDVWLREKDESFLPPTGSAFDFCIDEKTCDWAPWSAPAWHYPKGDTLDFASILVPTVDSTRTSYLIKQVHKQKKATLIVGSEGTAKTATVRMFLASLDMLTRTCNYSFATKPFGAQNAVESELDKRGGKNFGPPNSQKMTFFIDDMSMPEVNNWGDQPTLELMRQLIEYNGFCFLDKDKRGDFKTCEDLMYIAGMGHPGGGRNDIPNRLKRQFYCINLTPPSINSINDIYGQMLSGRFPSATTDAALGSVVQLLTQATIGLWKLMQTKMLPTPAKFHYVFNMRDLSRVFQGVLMTPYESIKTGGTRGKEGTWRHSPPACLLAIWKHECFRVFQDKLTNNKDKEFCLKAIVDQCETIFGSEVVSDLPEDLFMVNFLQEDVYDEDGVMQEEAPKVYEPGGSLAQIRDRVQMFLDKYNEDYPSRKMELVLFDDALKHLLRLNRLMEMPRGSGLLVGVGGSGKQSLTRLSAHISRASCFQITLTKTYNQASLIEDLRTLYRSAGACKQTVFLFTESEIKSETFLELLNSVLMTGEVPGLFAKDEMMAMTADLRGSFLKNRAGLEDTQDNLKQYFTDCVRDNLHLMLCMSPLNPKFPERARRFPGIISSPTIDWFLAWPEEALVAVSRGFIGNFEMSCSSEIKDNLMTHMGMVHNCVHKLTTDVCSEYFEKLRRAVYQTPKSYLSFIQSYTKMYKLKLAELEDKEGRVKLGLEKLKQGARDVEDMKGVLAEEDKKLAVATEETNKMLEGLQISSAEAQREGDKVAKDKAACEADAARIGEEKAAAEADLAKAQPFVDRANKAIESIKPKDIQEIKANKNPTDIIKMIFDCILILFKQPLDTVKPTTLSVKKEDLAYFETSFKFSGQKMLGGTTFLADLQEFGKTGKDLMNEETVEFLFPYVDLSLEQNGAYFTPEVAKKASSAAEGLCIFAAAMKDYFYASRVVKPKLEALGIAEANLNEAAAKLRQAEARLKTCQDKLDELQAMFERQTAEKKLIEDNAAALQKKMSQASELIGGLSGEQKRWTDDANEFAEIKLRLVGDCAIACAFVSYCGPFNQDYRSYMLEDKYSNDCETRGVPVSQNLNVIDFLADIGTIGDWNQEGLPTDPLSIQNGILVTRSSRFPLLIDPQGQAVGWICEREKDRVPPTAPTVQLTDPKLKDKLEFALQEGKAFIVLGVEQDIDPMLDPVLEKTYVQKGRRYVITISDKQMDYDMNFMAYFITRLPNPSFSPELQAKTTVVDFTVTQKGLEEQLLGKVIGKEQRALEDQLSLVLQEVNSNTKSLLALDASLLERLTSNTGNLLEDEELIDVLASTKAKAQEVSQKLIAADETKASINEKREQFRPVATRGSVLYFAIVEMSAVNPMYQTSLTQFLELFMASMEKSERASLASKRVENIIEAMTYITYRYINRGLYEADKLTFVLICTLKILVTAGMLKSSDVMLFLRGGAALDINSVKRKPFSWLTNDAWLNVLELSSSLKFFSNMPSDMSANEAIWRRWYEDNEPEQMAVPDYETKIAENLEIGPFLRLLVLRSLRMDRCILQTKEFIRSTPQMGPRYVEPVTDTADAIYAEMISTVPVIFLLSAGADPTDSIELLARKRKLPPPAVISLGEGQEPVAIKAINTASAEGTWVLLQNCELALELMTEMEQLLMKLPTMCTKVTNEPPAGLKAGLLRSYTVIVDQERLERVETEQWRQLLFALCFLHSIVQERRKFGPLGWGVPYEYNTGDVTACILFLERHLYNGPISWSTLQYMVAEVQYGGKITDSVDRRLFNTYAQHIANDFVYLIPKATEIAPYRAFVESFPEIDSPEVFGLHPNAELTFRIKLCIKEVNELITTLAETQPKGGGGGGGGESREDIVQHKARELLDRLPADYVEDDYKAKINKLGGLSVPLNIFLFQEIQRLQNVIAKVRFQLTQLQLAIKGEVVMTGELQEALDKIADASAPRTWIYTVTGDEFSWILPTLGLWFSSLMARDDQSRTWLNSGRPPCYWLTGFFNPTGFLTAMKQEVTRKHKSDKWALDDVVYRTEVTQLERVEQVRSQPPEGVYLHGMFLDGAAFDKKESLLVESEPKKLFVSLPILFVSGLIKDESYKRRKELFGAHGPYECPVYKYRPRTDRFFIFFVTLKCTTEKNAKHWTLRGTALLTTDSASS